MSTKVLVTGANGQLGRCLQEFVVSHNSNIDWHFKTSEELDITNKEALFKIFSLTKFNYLINCAAYTAVDKAETEREKAFLVNAEAVKYLAEACKLNNTIFIYISTDFVFDGEKETPYTEDDIPNPINVYGSSKLQGERYIKEILEKHFIIRTSWLYSEYGKNFMKTMIKLSIDTDELRVVHDQIGTPTYAKDLAEVIFNVINTKTNKYGIYHYSNEGVISWYDFAKAIFELTQTGIKLDPIKTEAHPTSAKRPKYSVLDKTKIKQIFNIKILHWQDSLKTAISNI